MQKSLLLRRIARNNDTKLTYSGISLVFSLSLYIMWRHFAETIDAMISVVSQCRHFCAKSPGRPRDHVRSAVAEILTGVKSPRLEVCCNFASVSHGLS